MTERRGCGRVDAAGTLRGIPETGARDRPDTVARAAVT